MLRLDLLVLALTLAVPTAFSAQTTADSGSFVVRRAGDTVAIERFSRTGIKLEGTLVRRNPKKTSERYSVDREGRVLGGRIPSQDVVVERQ